MYSCVKSLPITVGESVLFPNNYAAVVWDSLTSTNYTSITPVKINLFSGKKFPNSKNS